MSDSPLVIYHGRCTDGFCAAWVARAFLRQHTLDPEMVAADYDSPLPNNATGRHVYVLDFSYKPEQMLELYRDAASLTVLDHHKTAISALSELDLGLNVRFDMNRSGAGMAWDFFFGDERPWPIDYVEDRDLWRWNLPNSKEINAYLGTLSYDFDVWSALKVTSLASAIEHGKTVVAKVSKYCEEMIKEARPVTVCGYTVPVVNAPVTDVSELLGQLVRREFAPAGGLPAFSMAWRQRKDLRFEYSLRSVGDFDVSAIAKTYGGGGHLNAAGFTTDTLIV